MLERLAGEDAGHVAMANFNSPTQIVISGDVAAVQAASQPMLDAGAKRVVPLNVSGAWHSVLMEPAVERLSAAVEKSHFRLPEFDVISNVDGRPYRDAQTIKENLVRSVVEEVRWHDTAERMFNLRPGSRRGVRREQRARRIDAANAQQPAGVRRQR